MSSERPTSAFVLSLIGGIFVIIGGLVVAIVGAALTFFIGGLGGFFGLLGIVWGILIIVFAVQLNSNPSTHSTSGALIIVFSVLSWLGSFGGLFIGFLLGLIGGILAVAWNPKAGAPAQSVTPSSVMQTGMKYCVNCGTQIPASTVFCPKCGAKQP